MIDSEIPRHRKRGGQPRPFLVQQKRFFDGVESPRGWFWMGRYTTRARAEQAIEAFKRSWPNSQGLAYVYRIRERQVIEKEKR